MRPLLRTCRKHLLSGSSNTRIIPKRGYLVNSENMENRRSYEGGTAAVKTKKSNRSCTVIRICGIILAEMHWCLCYLSYQPHLWPKDVFITPPEKWWLLATALRCLLVTK